MPGSQKIHEWTKKTIDLLWTAWNTKQKRTPQNDVPDNKSKSSKWTNKARRKRTKSVVIFCTETWFPPTTSVFFYPSQQYWVEDNRSGDCFNVTTARRLSVSACAWNLYFSCSFPYLSVVCLAENRRKKKREIKVENKSDNMWERGALIYVVALMV